MEEGERRVMKAIARNRGTPCYVYFVDPVRARFDALETAFGGRFGVSYAVKCNPSLALLRRLRDKVTTLDISSIGEAERALAAGYPARMLSFSGPAKRPFELIRAVELGVGEMVCESVTEMEVLDRLAGSASRRMRILVRINPRRAPRHFGVNMAGKPSQFGIDEEDMGAALEQLGRLQNLELIGFHIYAGTNSLSEEAIAENFGIFTQLFTRFSEMHDFRPRKLIFGSGFGIPYLPEQAPLDLEKLAALINPQVDAMRKAPRLAGSECVLEMGRWLVGPHGFFLTSVVGEKRSRGTDIRLCDAGFNDHLGACGMMGTVIRRNWHFWKINASGEEQLRKYLLVGPLCTTIDVLATNIELPELHVGDVLAVGSSGAYGLSASPTRFISHPEPREYLVSGMDGEVNVFDISELDDRELIVREVPIHGCV